MFITLGHFHELRYFTGRKGNLLKALLTSSFLVTSYTLPSLTRGQDSPLACEFSLLNEKRSARRRRLSPSASFLCENVLGVVKLILRERRSLHHFRARWPHFSPLNSLSLRALTQFAPCHALALQCMASNWPLSRLKLFFLFIQGLMPNFSI